MRILHTLSAFALLALCAFTANAQSESRDLEPEQRKVIPRNDRFVVSAGVGLMPTFLVGGSQDRPVIQGTFQYYLNDRIAVGLGYANSESTSEPFNDFEGVTSWMTSNVTHVGARLSGTIVRTGPVEFYGGLQLGVNTVKATYRHDFPEGLVVESEEFYLAERPNPFGQPRTQMSTIGFFGVSVEVLPHVHIMSEVGNNLSLAMAGLEVRF
ncbi:MAG: hypothetical protein AB8F78_18690 [Saprospiraceae bacterium]